MSHCYTRPERYEAFIIGVPGLPLTGQVYGTGQKFYSFLFKQEEVAAPVISTFSSSIAFLEEAFVRNIINMLSINYEIWLQCALITIKTVIINNYGRLQELILLIKIPMGTWKNLFQIYRQFGHAPSESFARSSPETFHDYCFIKDRITRYRLYFTVF